jgi:hypothetical protein
VICDEPAGGRPLPPDEALVVVEPYFEAVREQFVEYGLDKCARTRLVCAPWVHDSPRHFAACSEDGRTIYVAPEVADLPDNTVMAILGHEFGHATDFAYPARFALGRDGVVQRDFDSVSEKQVRAWLTGWQRRGRDVEEVTADKIAEEVLNIPIGYSGPCELQSFNVGHPRPMGLR